MSPDWDGAARSETTKFIARPIMATADYEVNTWIAFFAPAGTPKEAAAAIETAIKEAVVLPEFRARIEATGAVVRSGSADELRTLLAGDVAKWAKLAKDNNIKLAP